MRLAWAETFAVLTARLLMSNPLVDASKSLELPGLRSNAVCHAAPSVQRVFRTRRCELAAGLPHSRNEAHAVGGELHDSVVVCREGCRYGLLMRLDGGREMTHQQHSDVGSRQHGPDRRGWRWC